METVETEKKSVCAFACVLTALSCAAALGNGWTKTSKDPVFGSPELGTCFDVNVIADGPKKFNMYFSWRARQAIARTTSDDGVNWSEPEVCLKSDATSGWEDKANRSGTVYWNGEYHLWYTGQARGFSRIGYAKSKDGVNFVRVTRQPVLIPERPHEGFSVMNPYVMRDTTRGVWRMWYASGETYEPNVICYAESADGVTRWERLAANPLVIPTPGGWDASAVYKPSVAWDAEADCWRLWYNGRRGPNEFVGMAVHPGYDLGPVAAAPAWGALERAKVTGDWTPAKSLLAAFARNYAAWEAGWMRKSLSLADPGVSCVRPIRGVPFKVGYRAERGLFDCPGDREGAEFALSADGARPLVNALLWAEASALAEIARTAGDAALSACFAAKAAALERNVKARLWNPGRAFFTARAVDGTQDDVCELTGYAPFAVGMPLAGFGAAWRGIVDERGFLAPKGLVFPRRDTPGFAPGAVDVARHECLWNGPSWPYATSVALTGLARALHGGLEMPVGREDFARLMALYARQHVRVREDGRTVPWIDENLSGFTGEWLARDILIAQAKAEGRKPAYHERGKDYNHSTFCDLVITGLCGLVPQTDGALRVDPLAPAAWDWWCLDGVRYHGRDVTVLFDRDGTHYGRGQGLVILDPKGRE